MDRLGTVPSTGATKAPTRRDSRVHFDLSDPSDRRAHAALASAERVAHSHTITSRATTLAKSTLVLVNRSRAMVRRTGGTVSVVTTMHWTRIATAPDATRERALALVTETGRRRSMALVARTNSQTKAPVATGRGGHACTG